MGLTREVKTAREIKSRSREEGHGFGPDKPE